MAGERCSGLSYIAHGEPATEDQRPKAGVGISGFLLTFGAEGAAATG
jgi:hypothetical protein